MPARGGSQGGPLGRASALWVAALRDAFADVEWVDRDLELAPGRAVDWIGIDASGRVVFALVCDGEDESAVLSVLDTLVFFERNRPILAQHLRSPRVRTGLTPIVALVAESFSEVLLARLCVLGGASLRTFELRQLSSSIGERAYLVPVTPGFSRHAPATPRGKEPFLAGVPEAQRPIADLLVRRIGRIDDQLIATAGDRSLAWRMGDELLCSIAQIDGQIEGQIPPAGLPREIGTANEVEGFVDSVLKRYVALLASTPVTPVEGGEPAGFVAVDPGMTLSPEEIAAFRQSG